MQRKNRRSCAGHDVSRRRSEDCAFRVEKLEAGLVGTEISQLLLRLRDGTVSTADENFSLRFKSGIDRKRLGGAVQAGLLTGYVNASAFFGRRFGLLDGRGLISRDSASLSRPISTVPPCCREPKSTSSASLSLISAWISR